MNCITNEAETTYNEKNVSIILYGIPETYKNI